MSDHVFFYKEDGMLIRINLDLIRFLEARDNYVLFYLAPKKTKVSNDFADSNAPSNVNTVANGGAPTNANVFTNGNTLPGAAVLTDTNTLAESKTSAETNNSEASNTATDLNEPPKLKTLTLRTSLDTVVKKLPPGLFLRTHRAFVVPVKHIKCIFRDYLVVVDHGEGIPISKQHYPGFIKQINILGPGFPGRNK